MKLWLVRHAQPCVAAGVCYGALDVAAEPEATQSAALVLAKHLPTATAVWCLRYKDVSSLRSFYGACGLI